MSRKELRVIPFNGRTPDYRYYTYLGVYIFYLGYHDNKTLDNDNMRGAVSVSPDFYLKQAH